MHMPGKRYPKCEHGRGPSACPLCRGIYEKALLERDPAYKARQRKNAADWRKKYPERARQYDKAKTERERHDPAVKKRKRIRKFERQFGLSEQQVVAILEGGCAICGGRERLCVDHDHASGRFRGCLCHACNIGLGFVERPGDWLERALSYLRNTASRKAG
jgi:hypothetical protein